jgi:cytochrome c-type biogenesis protein
MSVAALLIAFGGGVVSFLSPCTLPLVPGYLAYMSGIGTEDVQVNQRLATVVPAALLFVLGFSLIFVSLGATASYIGAILGPERQILTRIAGLFIIGMALVMIGIVQFPSFFRERRLRIGRDLGIWSAFPLGMAFAFGWTPCIGPVLTAILGIATQEDSVRKGAALLFAYALGLGLPFLAVALFAGRFLSSLAVFKRHYRVLNLVSAGVLLAMGVFLSLNRWTQLLGPAMDWYANLQMPA